MQCIWHVSILLFSSVHFFCAHRSFCAPPLYFRFRYTYIRSYTCQCLNPTSWMLQCWKIILLMNDSETKRSLCEFNLVVNTMRVQNGTRLLNSLVINYQKQRVIVPSSLRPGLIPAIPVSTAPAFRVWHARRIVQADNRFLNVYIQTQIPNRFRLIYGIKCLIIIHLHDSRK